MAVAATLSLEELVQELERRERQDPLAEAYSPTARQLEIHRSRAPIRISQGANRSGKSTALVVESLLFCLHRPVYAELPEAPVTVWYVMPSLGMFQRVIYPILTKVLPWGVVQSFPTKPHPVITFTNGSTLHFLSADMRQRRLQGASVHLVVMDETPDEAAFDELQARVMDTRGYLLLGFLPDQASGWVDTRLVIPYQVGDRKDVFYTEMAIADEVTGEPLVPWFTKEDIEAFKRKWPDPAIQAARIYGRRVRQAGLVFKSHEAGVHHVPEFPIPKNWTRWLVCDPQYYRFGVLWFNADEHGNYFVSDEFFSQESTLRDRAMRMAAITDARGHVDLSNPLPVYCDSANPQDIAELNWHFSELNIPLAALTLPFRKVKDTRHDDSMILRVYSLLEPNEESVYPEYTHNFDYDIYGSPRLFFFDSLYSTWLLDGVAQYGSRLFWELSRYSWDRSGKPDKRTADGADLCDCFDEETEVLTRAGWKRFRDVDVGASGDLFATVNLASDTIEYQHAFKKIERDYSGDLIALRGKAIDVRVTPGHRMVVERAGRTYVRLARELTMHQALKVRSLWEGCSRWSAVEIPASVQRCAGKEGTTGAVIFESAAPASGDWAELLGWYVAEGCRWTGVSHTQHNRRYRVTISQHPGPKYEALVDLCARLPWKFHRIKDGIVFPCKQLYDAMSVCGDKAIGKKVPQWVKDAPPQIIERFVRGAVLGDGWWEKGVRRYATVSRTLADDMQELFIKLGRASGISVRPAQRWSIEGREGRQQEQYCVTEHKSANRWLTDRFRGGQRSLISKEPYCGKVYCVSVPNGTLFVRRGGKVVIAGNCLCYGANIMARAEPPPAIDRQLKKLPPQDRLLWSKILSHDARSALARR